MYIKCKLKWKEITFRVGLHSCLRFPDLALVLHNVLSLPAAVDVNQISIKYSIPDLNVDPLSLFSWNSFRKSAKESKTLQRKYFKCRLTISSYNCKTACCLLGLILTKLAKWWRSRLSKFFLRSKPADSRLYLEYI